MTVVEQAATSLSTGAGGGVFGNTRPKLSPLQQQLYDLVLGAQRNGADNLTRRELQQAWEYRHNKRIGEGNVSGRVAEMLAGRWLIQSTNRRTCRVSGSLSVHTVFVPAVQGRLPA